MSALTIHDQEVVSNEAMPQAKFPFWIHKDDGRRAERENITAVTLHVFPRVDELKHTQCCHDREFLISIVFNVIFHITGK